MIVRKIIKTQEQLFLSLNHLLWPATCMHCHSLIGSGSEILCGDCWQGLFDSTNSDYCPSCGVQVSRYAIIDGKCNRCVASNNNYDGIARVSTYSSTLRSMILSLKLSDKQEYLKILSSMLRSSLDGRAFPQEIDYLIPVPIHWTRQLSRGFNQSLLLAKELGDEYLVIDALARIKMTRMQPGLSPAGRKRNIKGAFALRRGNNIRGKNLCLVDDIKTSGATLNECAKILKDAGAAKVYALVLAVADKVNS